MGSKKYSNIIFFKACLAVVAAGFTSACSMDASILDMNQVLAPIEDLNRKEPDFIHGELVTTNNGYQVKAVFGEISEKTTTSNGWQIEGVFYE